MHLDRHNAPRLLASGGVAGGLSGFFGIGGRFLIVPGLMMATEMPILNAVGSSLLAVMAFGLTTTFNYAASGWVDWYLAAIFVLGGVLGGIAGSRSAGALSLRRGALNRIFACLIFGVAFYMLYKSAYIFAFASRTGAT